MGSWRKLLAQMVADRDPRSYSYQQAVTVLEHLQFTHTGGKGSHRVFRRSVPDPSVPGKQRGVIVGLKQCPGSLKPSYISTMITTLRANNLLPSEVD